MFCLFLQCIMQRCILFMLRLICKHDNIMHHIITPFLEFNELCIGVNLGLCADVNMHKNRRMWSSEFTAARVVWSIATSPGLNKLQPKKPLRNTTRTTIKWTLIIQYTLLHYSYVYCIWPLNPVNPTVPQYCVKVHQDIHFKWIFHFKIFVCSTQRSDLIIISLSGMIRRHRTNRDRLNPEELWQRLQDTYRNI